MTAPKAMFHKPGDVRDYLAGSDKLGGAPVEVNNRAGILQADVASGYSGSAQVKGVVKIEKVNEAWVDGDVIYWDADGDPYGGTAGSGAATKTASNGDFVLGAAVGAASATATHGYVDLNASRMPVPIELDNGTGAVSGAKLLGSGTSSDRTEVTEANAKFLSFYLENKATSGDNRGMYLRLYLSGAGGGGEAARLFTTVNDVAAGTAHGSHSSLSFASSGSITGLGAGQRSTLHVPDAAVVAGTYCGAMSELYADGDASDISGATEHSIHRFVNSGDATGAATATTVLAFAGLSTGAGKMFHDVTISNLNEFTKTLRVVVNGTAYLIPLKAA